MANFQSILAAIGIGGARVEIDVDSGAFPRGAPVLGNVILTGGIAPQRIEHVWLTVHEFERRGKSEHVRKSLGIALSPRPIIIEPHQRSVLPFSFLMPHDMPLSPENFFNRIRSGCRLVVDAPILWAVDPRAVKDIPVCEHREIMAMKGAMRRLGFEEAWKLRLLEPPKHIIRKDYRAGVRLEEWLDGATIELTADGDHVRGRLILDRREFSIADRLHALSGADKVECPIQIPCSALLDRNGQPNVGAALRTIQKILDDSMLMPTDARNVLLRPAASPKTDADTLLHPAGPVDTESDTLLRPSTD